MAVERFDDNPLITPADVKPTRSDVEVLCTINPGAVWLAGDALMLLRVGEKPIDEPGYVGTLTYDHVAGETVVHRYKLDDPDLEVHDGRTFAWRGQRLLTSMSHLRLAQSHDLIHWTIAETPAITPTTEWEAYGCEDARITEIDGRYWITYTAAGPLGINVMLAVTDDFASFDKMGVIATTFNKDVCIFPEKIHGRFVCRHRPFRTDFNAPCIWTAWSPDLIHWGDHSVLHRPVPGTWESERVGCGAAPIRTDAGWLEIYHGSDTTGRYGLGAMLSELDHPERMISRSPDPILIPAAPYELKGVFDECVYTNGYLIGSEGELTILYGGADTITAAARTTIDDMIVAALGG